jgi:glycerol-3-phosphate dehydrogenase
MLADASDHSAAEIAWIARNEHVVHLDDVVLRRTSLAVTGRLTQRDLVEIAGILAGELGWKPARVSEELARTTAILAAKHRLVPR